MTIIITCLIVILVFVVVTATVEVESEKKFIDISVKGTSMTGTFEVEMAKQSFLGSLFGFIDFHGALVLTSTEGTLVSVEKGGWKMIRYAIKDNKTEEIKTGSFDFALIQGIFSSYRFDCKSVQAQYTD